MKTILRLALAAALISGVFGAMRRDQQRRWRNRAKSPVPKFIPPGDPVLTDDDLSVAQNSPL